MHFGFTHHIDRNIIETEVERQLEELSSDNKFATRLSKSVQ